MNIEPALKALAAALHGEGPAVELSAGPDGAPVLVTPSQTPGIEDAAVVVRTSGSTGTPKATVLTVDALAASSMATAFALKGEGQWLLALPVQYVAGVQVLVRSLFAGTRPVGDGPVRRFHRRRPSPPRRWSSRTRSASPRWCPPSCSGCWTDPSAETLAVLRRFNAHPARRRPRACRAARAARDAGVRVVDHLRRVRETCGGCVYDGFPLEGVAGPGAEDGRILLGGATIAAGYLRRPGAHGSGIQSRTDGVRWYRTNDLGELDADGRLTVLGRADDVVITGGVKVSAAHVQAELEKLDGVRAAFVAGVPSAEWGQALAAYVAVADSSPEGMAAFADRRNETWAPALGAWPRKRSCPPAELLMLPNGKPDRLGMTVLLDALHQGK